MFNYYIMKLIRLSTTNNGHFKSTFGNDMTIAPNSKMALLNLTFESDIGSRPGMKLIGNSIIKMTGDTSNSTNSEGETNIFGDDFSDGDFERFKTTVEWYLNTLPQINYGTDGATTPNLSNVSGSAWRITDDVDRLGQSNNGNIIIEYSYAQLVNPLHIPTDAADPDKTQYVTIMEHDAQITAVTLSGAGPYESVTIAKDAPQLATANTTNNLFSSVPMAKGSSWFTARVANLVDNTSGLQDNGFGIGVSTVPLSSLNHQPGEEIPGTARHFEIRVNRPGESYKFITNDGLEQSAEDALGAPLTPENYSFVATANVNKHDIMSIEVAGGNIELVVYQNANGGTDGLRTSLAKVPYDVGTEYYPYIYIRGISTDCNIDLVNYVADPFTKYSPEDIYLNLDLSGYENRLGSMLQDPNTNIRKLLPLTDSDNTGVGGRWSAGGYDNPDGIQMTVGIPENILYALGNKEFNQLTGTTYNFPTRQISIRNYSPQGVSVSYNWTHFSDVLPDIYSSDHFLVESMSLPLDSFDASDVEYNTVTPFNANMSKSGRRKNILMTISENDNTNGLLEFETSTPIFIDINNTEPINVKNLDFRVLRKDFSPIRQSGEPAIMTVLISE